MTVWTISEMKQKERNSSPSVASEILRSSSTFIHLLRCNFLFVCFLSVSTMQRQTTVACALQNEQHNQETHLLTDPRPAGVSVEYWWRHELLIPCLLGKFSRRPCEGRRSSAFLCDWANQRPPWRACQVPAGRSHSWLNVLSPHLRGLNEKWEPSLFPSCFFVFIFICLFLYLFYFFSWSTRRPSDQPLWVQVTSQACLNFVMSLVPEKRLLTSLVLIVPVCLVGHLLKEVRSGCGHKVNKFTSHWLSSCWLGIVVCVLWCRPISSWLATQADCVTASVRR